MTKRRFRIDTFRGGGETVIGEVSADFVRYWAPKVQEKGDNDLVQLVLSYESEEEDDIDPNSPKPREDFYFWYENDDIEHLNSSYAGCGFTINEVPADCSDDMAYGDIKDEIESEGHSLYVRKGADFKVEEPENLEDIVPVLACLSEAKGNFGNYFFETNGEDFDPSKLAYGVVSTTISEGFFDEIDSWETDELKSLRELSGQIDTVYYDGKELECNGDWMEADGVGFSAQVGWLNKKLREGLERIDKDYLKLCWEELSSETQSTL